MKKIPIAYQLYSAREEAAKNLDGVIARIAELGYQGVEFAGFHGHSAGEITAMLGAHGLSPVSSHVPLAEIEADMFGVIAYHHKIGCPFIAVPYLDEDTRPGAPGFARTLRTIHRFGALCREAGIQLLYHNHDFEFEKLSGQYGLDFLYDALAPSILAAEVDTCWVKYAGEDPAAYLRKYAGRVPVVHLKDYVGERGKESPYGLIGKEEKAETGTPFTFKPLGHGCQDIRAIVEASIESGAQWFVVEQDLSTERLPLEDAALSIETLRGIGIV